MKKFEKIKVNEYQLMDAQILKLKDTDDERNDSEDYR